MTVEVKQEEMFYGKYKNMQSDSFFYILHKGEYNKKDKTIEVFYAEVPKKTQEFLMKEFENLVLEGKNCIDRENVLNNCILRLNADKVELYEKLLETAPKKIYAGDFYFDNMGIFRSSSLQYQRKLEELALDIIEKLYNKALYLELKPYDDKFMSVNRTEADKARYHEEFGKYHDKLEYAGRLIRNMRFFDGESEDVKAKIKESWQKFNKMEKKEEK